MRKLPLFIAFVAAACVAAAAQQAEPREVYRVHFFKAAPGKLEDLLDAYRNLPATDPQAPRPLLFRHVVGDDWDVLAIYPLGARFSMEADPPLTEAQRRFRERVMADYVWHTDTYATGPSLAAFQRALGLTADSPAGRNAIYQVSDYTALPGHGAQLNDVLRRIMSTSRPATALKLDHVHGASWDSLLIYRYGSWAEVAAESMDPDADEKARRAGFADAADIGKQFRLHAAGHHDSYVSRVP